MKEIYIVIVDDEKTARHRVLRNIQLSQVKNLVKTIEFENIHDYLSWIDKNVNSVCGVFLDINFASNAGNSNQDGITALKITREKYCNLPVSIMTSTDSFENENFEISNMVKTKKIVQNLGITAYIDKGELSNSQIRDIALQYYHTYIGKKR